MTVTKTEADAAHRGGREDSLAELVRALGVLCEPPTPNHRVVAEALDLGVPPEAHVHSHVFLFQLYPYASIYLGEEGMLGGEARDRIAGFWRALRLKPPEEPDHLSVLLGLYATLLEAVSEEADSARRLLLHRAKATLLGEHLLSWMPPYLTHFDAEDAGDFYAGWADLLLKTLLTEAGKDGPTDAVPRHLGDVPALPDPRTDGAAPFLSGLLAPARSGLVLTRSDLARASRELGLGLRVGERAYTLRALLAQESRSVLSWLAVEAGGRAARYRERAAPLAGITEFWAERARTTGRVLEELSRASVRFGEGSGPETAGN